MIRDKRRHEAPEDRRDYQDKLNKREARAEEQQFVWLTKAEEDPSVIHGRSPSKSFFEATAAALGVKNELIAFASKISKFTYMDEWITGDPNSLECSHYLNSTDWPGYKPEPEGMTGKEKKRWHHVQFKAHKAWRDGEYRRIEEEKRREQELAELEEQRKRELVELDALAEETVLAEGRKDLGWGGF